MEIICGIYKITNQINNKVYIGQSTNIHKRWREHICTANSYNYYNHSRSLLYPAINKYGINNFTFEVIEECNQLELDDKEEKWIAYYNSTDVTKGYNLLNGGKQGRQYSPEIFCNLWDTGLSIKEIAEQTGASYTTIEQHLRNYDNYSISESISRGNRKSNNYEKLKDNTPIYQYDLLGNYLNTYISVYDASIALFGDSKHLAIRYALQSKNHMAYDYLWSYEKVDKMNLYTANNIRAVQCIETKEIFISTREAARAYNLKSPSGIIACCKGNKKQKTAGKDKITNMPLHWQYYNE